MAGAATAAPRLPIRPGRRHRGSSAAHRDRREECGCAADRGCAVGCAVAARAPAASAASISFESWVLAACTLTSRGRAGTSIAREDHPTALAESRTKGDLGRVRSAAGRTYPAPRIPDRCERDRALPPGGGWRRALTPATSRRQRHGHEAGEAGDCAAAGVMAEDQLLHLAFQALNPPPAVLFRRRQGIPAGGGGFAHGPSCRWASIQGATAASSVMD